MHIARYSEKRMGNIVVYLIPVVVLLIGIIAYSIVIPDIIGKKASSKGERKVETHK